MQSTGLAFISEIRLLWPHPHFLAFRPLVLVTISLQVALGRYSWRTYCKPDIDTFKEWMVDAESAGGRSDS